MQNTLIANEKNKAIRLLATHGLMLISRVSTKIFLSAYILKVTGNIGDVAGYYATYYTVAALVFLFAGRYCSKGGVLLLYRIGFAANLVFFLSLLVIGSHIGNFVFPLGVLYGIANGLYWLPYNILKYEHNARGARKSYFSNERALEEVINVVVPFVAGYSILESGSYFLLFGTMAFLFLLAYALSASLGWDRENKNTDYHPLHYVRLVWKKTEVMQVYKASFLSGFSFFGALDVIVPLLLFLTLGNEFNLGIAASILPCVRIATALGVGYLLKKPQNYRSVVWLGALLLVVAISFLLVGGENKGSVIAYATLFAIGSPVLSIMQMTYSFNIIDEDSSLAEFRTEHLVIREICINAGRVLSFLPLIALSSTLIEATWVKIVLAILALSSLLMAWYLHRVKISS
jgi:MFS transporter, YQGE family, putative transporter